VLDIPGFHLSDGVQGGGWEISISTWIRIDLRCFPLTYSPGIVFFVPASFLLRTLTLIFFRDFHCRNGWLRVPLLPAKGVFMLLFSTHPGRI
jgi:hypothetical protein